MIEVRLIDLRNKKVERGDFKIILASDTLKDDNAIRKLVIGLLEKEETEIALEYSTDGGSGVIYLKCK